VIDDVRNPAHEQTSRRILLGDSGSSLHLNCNADAYTWGASDPTQKYRAFRSPRSKLLAQLTNHIVRNHLLNGDIQRLNSHEQQGGQAMLWVRNWCRAFTMLIACTSSDHLFGGIGLIEASTYYLIPAR
jgi:hypothetical protein